MRDMYPLTPEELVTFRLLPSDEQDRLFALRNGRPEAYSNFGHETSDPGCLGNWIPPKELMGGGVQGWEECLESITTDGVQISNSTSETIICPDCVRQEIQDLENENQ